MFKFRLLLAAIAILGLTQCIDETYFGESEKADIVKFTIEGETANRIEPLVDWRDVGTVSITVPETADLSDLTVTAATCSQLAHFETDPLLLKDFSKPVELYVVAEKAGVRKKWVIEVAKTGTQENEQLAFSDMNEWTDKNNQGIGVTVNGVTGQYPGNGVDNSPWNSSIQSNGYGNGFFKELTTYPIAVGGGKAARVQTIRTASSIAEQMGMGLASGGMFVGEFVFNPSFMLGTTKYPRKMMNQGVAFHSKPVSVKFKMRYQPGPVMMDGKCQEINEGNANGRPTKDGCDIYFILQDRKSVEGKWVRVGAAAFRTERGETLGDFSDDANGFVEMEIPFIYGEPTAEQLAEKKYCGIGGENGEVFFYGFTSKGDGTYDVSSEPVEEVYASDPETAAVDHIIALFSSSVNGDLFYAAPGSKLDVKDIEFVY